MNHFFLLTLSSLVSATPALAQDGGASPAPFAHRADITVASAAPYQKLVLPLAVYQGLQRADAGDLRVFNGNGEMLPYALLPQQDSAAPPGAEVAVALFPLLGADTVDGADGAAIGGGLSLQVTRRRDDSLAVVASAPAAGAASQVVRGAILDLSRLRTDPAAPARHTLRLVSGAPAGASATAPRFQSFTLETSDDLQHWASVPVDGQLVHLEHDGQRIERDSVTWDGVAGKYLRLLWATPSQAPVVWSAALAPQSGKDGQYDYALPGQMPLQQLRINLAQSNTLAPVTIQRDWPASGRRRDGDGSWQTIYRGVTFRLQAPARDVTSPDIALDQGPASRLRLVVDQRGGGIGAQGPTLQVGFTPALLLFLARGAGPYSLAWGAAKVASAQLAPATLMPGYVAGQPPAAALATLQAVAAPAVPAQQASQAPVSKGILWAVLVAGVLVLAGMAACLLRQLKQGDQQAPP